MHPKIATAGADLLSVNARERAIRAPLVTLSLMRMLGLTTALASVVIVPVKAASADTPASTASAERKFTLNIPAQKLSSALVALSNATGTQLAYGTQLSDGLRSSAISGAMSVSAALTQILNGTGLTYRLNGNVVMLTKVSTITLGPVRVGGTYRLSPVHQSPIGPGVGYVADSTLSATRTDTDLREVPISISVVTRAQMDDQGIQTVGQALRYTSGIVADQYGPLSFGTDNMRVRGFSPETYMDGIYRADNSATDPYELERIELLHGPASVMYGQASPGGLLNMVSKRPVDKPLHEIIIQGGSYGRVQGNLDFGGRLDKYGKFLYRITGVSRDSGTQEDHTKDDRLTIAPAITWKPDDKTSLTILSKYKYDPNITTYQTLPSIGTLTRSRNGFISRSVNTQDGSKIDNRNYQIGFIFDRNLWKNWSLQQSLRYEQSDWNNVYAYGAGYMDTTQTTIYRVGGNLRYNRWVVSLDTHIAGKFSTGPVHHTVLIGVDHRDLSYNSASGFGLASSLNVFNPVYGNAWAVPEATTHVKQKLSQTGVYFQEQLRFKKWMFLLGGREDWAGNYNIQNGSNSSAFNRAFSGRVGVVYLFDNGLSPYASFSESFQPQTGNDSAGKTFNPTRGKQWEVGIKYEPRFMNAFFTASLFNLTETNVLTTDQNNPNYQVQTGKVRARGAELEAHATLFKNASVVATYTYTDAINTKSNSGTQGKMLVSTPRNMVSAWADYRFSERALGGLNLGFGFRYTGYSYGTQNNSLKVHPYLLEDLTVGYNFGEKIKNLRGLSVALNSSNLTNKRYVATCTTASFCYYGAGRLFLGTVRYKW